MKVSAYLDTIRLIGLIALRNVIASRFKALIIGGIVLVGALLVVFGGSLLGSISQAMSRSIVDSVAGHIQVYSAASKDDLAVIGGLDPTGADLAPLDDFAKVRQAVLGVANVKAVVPMGISGALVSTGNTVDRALAELRALYGRKLHAGAGDGATGDAAALDAAIAGNLAHVRQMVTAVADNLERMKNVQEDTAESADDREAARRASSDEFWRELDRHPLESLEVLENRVAPQAESADPLYLQYLGTDPEEFERAFDRMQIVEGGRIPRGQTGFMLSKFVYEGVLKLKTARRLDAMKAAIDTRKASFAFDPELQQFVRENRAEVREILLQLDGDNAALFRDRLATELGSGERDVAKLLVEFFGMDDANFQRRYRFFYAVLAPRLQLYRLRVGDTLTIKAFTRRGYVRSISLKIHGVFTFAGLEKAPQAGTLNLMDLVSFRMLRGLVTDDTDREVQAMKASAGARDISRADAEAELFGSRPPADADDRSPSPSPSPSDDTMPSLRLDAPLAGLEGRRQRDTAVDRTYDPSLLKSGAILNAAVILRDPTRLEATIRQIEDAGRAAGLPLRAVSWQAASGAVGQFISMMTLVLYAAAITIFIVALMIISNALMIATLDRVADIGTLRAIGARSGFLLAMLLAESSLVGLLFGGIGAAAGAALVALIAKLGIPAASDALTFFFSGPVLRPTLEARSVLTGMATALAVSVLGGTYPAWLALRVTPRQAMGTED